MTDEQLAADLEAKVASLRNRIAAAPRNSRSAAEAAATLDGLDAYPTSAEKLAAVRRAGRELTDGMKYSDGIRDGFNLGPDSNPRPPRRK